MFSICVHLLSASFYLRSIVRTPNTSTEVKGMEFSLRLYFPQQLLVHQEERKAEKWKERQIIALFLKQNP